MGKNLNKGVRKAVELAGGTYNALAEKLKCSPEAVRKMLWVNCTAERAVEIEKAVGVPREEIRPDIFLKDGEQPPKPEPIPPLACSKELKRETTERAPRKNQKRQTQNFSSDDAQVIEPVPSADDIKDPGTPAAVNLDEHRAELQRRLKENPNVDIARPGRLVRVNAGAQPKPKPEGST